MLVANRINIRWSLNFVSDTFAVGRRVRALVFVDNYSLEHLALVVATSLYGILAVRELDALMATRGRPEIIVSDKGTEFTSMPTLSWSQTT